MTWAGPHLENTSPTCLVSAAHSLLDVNFALLDMAAYLRMEDLFKLCCTTKESVIYFKEKQVWHTVANYEDTGFIFAGLDKSTIKELLRVADDVEVIGEAMEVSGPEQARSLVRAARGAAGRGAQHLHGLGGLALTTATTFGFAPEEVEAWLLDPTHPLVSRAGVFYIGDDVLLLALCLHGGDLTLSVDAVSTSVHDAPLHRPLLVTVRGVSPSVILRQDFIVTHAGSDNHGEGLYSLPASRRAIAGALSQGLACVVLVRDASDGALRRFSRTLNALSLTCPSCLPLRC